MFWKTYPLFSGEGFLFVSQSLYMLLCGEDLLFRQCFVLVDELARFSKGVEGLVSP